MARSMNDRAGSARSLTRRGLLLGGMQAAIVAGLGLKLRSMQLDHAEEYRLQADGNSIKMQLLPPARGLIVDRNGVLVAGNEQNYSVQLTRAEAGDVGAVMGRLRHILPLSDQQSAALLAEISRRSAVTPLTVAERLSWQEVAAISLNMPALPGVTLTSSHSRNYPRRGDFAHVLGYVGPVSDYDLAKLDNPDPLLRLPQYQLGKVGIEAKLEPELRGRAGIARFEVNSMGRKMRDLSRQEGQQGAAIQLTLDAELQHFAVQRMGEESAAAVVIDIENGDVRAIASSPVFDPNLFVRGISSADYKGLMQHDHRPLADKSVQGLYPPGSTYKMVSLLAGLDAGLITAGSQAYCPGHLEVSGRRFHCWSRGGHGMVNAVQSLERSCDIYYYELAQKLGIERMSAMARRLGLGLRHDLPMSAIAEGIAPDRAWKKQRRGQDWQVGDTINASIGQGFVLASPLHLAVMTARIASGKALTPRLIKAVDGQKAGDQNATASTTDPQPLGLAERHLDLVRAGMDAVVNGRNGTSAKSRIVLPQWRMAGKSGTAQVRNISSAERARGVIRNENLPWHLRDHSLFVCYAPFDRPRYAVSVVLEHGTGSGTSAAMIARDILLFALAEGVPPVTAYPESQRNSILEMLRRLDVAASTSGQGQRFRG